MALPGADREVRDTDSDRIEDERERATEERERGHLDGANGRRSAVSCDSERKRGSEREGREGREWRKRTY